MSAGKNSGEKHTLSLGYWIRRKVHGLMVRDPDQEYSSCRKK